MVAGVELCGPSRGADGIARVRPAEGSISVLSGSPRRLPPVFDVRPGPHLPLSPIGTLGTSLGPKWRALWDTYPSADRRIGACIVEPCLRSLPAVLGRSSCPFPYGSRELARRWPDWCGSHSFQAIPDALNATGRKWERATPGCPSRDRGGVSTRPLHRLTTWPSPKARSHCHGDG
jgi:hypothetical protein